MNLTINQDTGSVSSLVRALASENRVHCIRTPIDDLAEQFTRLSGDDVDELDETQLLIIALRRAGVLDKFEAIQLQARYLTEDKVAV